METPRLPEIRRRFEAGSTSCRYLRQCNAISFRLAEDAERAVDLVASQTIRVLRHSDLLGCERIAQDPPISPHRGATPH